MVQTSMVQKGLKRLSLPLEPMDLLSHGRVESGLLY